MKKLINVATVKERLEKGDAIKAKALRCKAAPGYLLHLYDDQEEMILSTWLSDNPRLFKRSDALLKEAENMGLPEVLFDFKGE